VAYDPVTHQILTPSFRSVFAFFFSRPVSDHATTPGHLATRTTWINYTEQTVRTMSSTAMSKKNKGKKVADPNETSKLLAAKISQLEQDQAGEKDQEQEIGA
jgi:hypothetical protein